MVDQKIDELISSGLFGKDFTFRKGQREEVKSMREGIEAKMKALQKATTNPLGN
jgi:hypothetical protein